MKSNRRDFLKGAAVFAMAGATRAFAQNLADGKPVKIGTIGTGVRGTELTGLLAAFPNVEVPALCDIVDWKVKNACDMVEKISGKRPEAYCGDEYYYRKLLERGDLDGVMIATPIVWHIEMSIDAMNAGIHVGSEVTAGHDLDGLWDLVRAKEKTGKRYMLLENYVYTPHNMMVLNMVKQNLFGQPYYAECSYIHDCRNLRFNDDGTLTWRGESVRDFYGNSYPTHGLGPVSKWMGINDGDRMTHLVCMMTKPRVMHEYAVKRFGPDSDAAKVAFKLGEMNTSLIHTANGGVIRVDLDVHSPRPQCYYYLLQGTQGCYDTRTGVYVEDVSPWEQWEPIDQYYTKYEHPWWQKWGEQARPTGHWGSDHFVMYDFARMVQTDREPWLDVYDAASWSCIYHCTKESLDHGNAPVEMPDFTQGKWKDKDWRADHLKPVLHEA